MAVVKLVLRKKPNKEGKCPLTLRITQDRKSNFIYLGHHIDPADWDESKQRVKKSHPNSARLNNLIIKKLAEANDQSLELETQKSYVSAQAVKQRIRPSAGSTFFAQADLYLQRLKEAGKYNQYTADKPRVKHFKEFIKHDIGFPDITVAMLERFKAYVQNTLKLSERSAVNHIVMMRSVFSHAIKEGAVDSKHYPFGKGKMKIKFPESSKIGLNPDEIKNLETVTLDGNADHARNLWLVSYYFAGMRVSDLLRLRWSDFQNERLHYEMGKNSKSGSLKIPDKAATIIDRYKQFQENKDDLVFPELKGVDFNNKFVLQRTIAFKTSAIDKTLKTQVAPAAKIDKKLTMHLARHSFAQVASDKIPVQILQKLYRHSSIITTMGYQSNFTTQQTDDALDAVLNIDRKLKS
ncbi:tyrosine type site-specific recombinase [Fibrisoma limi BUZ 3]|uniref:Tyrosine type site-specific recombinase n=1 Tax=Fibrisoma limi BUZ 3 TaxID=1185876 RepID=I2GRQ5_9BACT|nr:site-specific integrase [Fibrisoma limi]CCH56583.1 tyrosine type site-specific recombinase [Fibrisoma limi BUZ 3]